MFTYLLDDIFQRFILKKYLYLGLFPQLIFNQNLKFQ
jgi:hypothetical protein